MEPLSIRRGKSRAINAENPTGEKGRGGMASSNLGKSRKGSPCLTNIAPGDEVVLADIQGAGVISHIWITVDDKTSEADCFVMRDLILRMYWDGEETPSVDVPLGDFFCCGFSTECYIDSAFVAVRFPSFPRWDMKQIPRSLTTLRICGHRHRPQLQNWR